MKLIYKSKIEFLGITLILGFWAWLSYELLKDSMVTAVIVLSLLLYCFFAKFVVQFRFYEQELYLFYPFRFYFTSVSYENIFQLEKVIGSKDTMIMVTFKNNNNKLKKKSFVLPLPDELKKLDEFLRQKNVFTSGLT